MAPKIGPRAIFAAPEIKKYSALYSMIRTRERTCLGSGERSVRRHAARGPAIRNDVCERAIIYIFVSARHDYIRLHNSMRIRAAPVTPHFQPVSAPEK